MPIVYLSPYVLDEPIMYARRQILPLVVLLATACSDKNTTLIEVGWECAESGRPGLGDRPCPPGKRYAMGACQASRCDATDVPLCCPGTVCNDGGECVVPASKLPTCSKDADCNADQVCFNQPMLSSSSKTCGFPVPNADQECPAGTNLFNHRCVVESPCGAKCRSGWVCNIGLNACERPPQQALSCDQTCGEGKILVYSDPDSMLFDQCCTVACECVDLPPLPAGDWGRFVDADRNSTRIFVSGYDNTYGDLVVAEYDPNTLKQTNLRYVDGIPTTGAIKANPNGPRGGRLDPGPNTGTHTSIAVRNGRPLVVYFDDESSALKWAGEREDGTFTTAFIHAPEANATIGQYTSMVVDPDGRMHVTYYAHHTTLNGEIITTPMYARSRTQDPTTPDDWERVAVEPLSTCSETCAPNTACVQMAGRAQCAPTSVMCAHCGCDQACVQLGNSGQCARKAIEFEAAPSTLVDIPRGNGTFTSLVLQGDIPVLVYHDSVQGHLRGAVADFAWNASAIGAFTSTVVDCSDGIPVGIQTSLAVSPTGDLLAAYNAPGGYGVYTFYGRTLFSGRITQIDDGIRDNMQRLLGGSTDVGFSHAGRPFIVYGDLTNNDLLLAFEADGGYGHRILLETGAFGTAQAMVISDDDHAHILGYRRALKQPGIAGIYLAVEDLRTFPSPQ